MNGDNGELISSLLGMLGDNPEEKIKSALSSLTDGKTQEQEDAKEPSGLDMDSILKIGGLLSSLNENDERTSLLNALKPFLSDEKKPKVDSALKLLKLAKMAEVAQKSDILKNIKL